MSELQVEITCQNYMGACFQAPHAAPGQQLIEMHYVH